MSLKPSMLATFIAATFFFLTFETHAYTTFGYRGQDGRDGQRGYSGRDGSSQTIYAQQGPAQLDISGTHAGPGGDAEGGGYASSCFQYLGHDDMLGAEGGDGGSGGNGGNGGDGGDTVIYYDNNSQLRQIYIDATPGEGAGGGRGSYGAPGCFCSQYFWQQTYTETRYRDESYQECTTRRICRREGDDNREVCRDERVCETRTRRVPYTYTYTRNFTCQDGRHGREGMPGSYGQRGSMGSITLIKKNSVLEPVRPRLNVALAQMVGQFELSDNEWAARNGASQLLAPGSRVADQYREWLGKRTHQVQIIWAVEGKDPADFGDGQVTLSLNNQRVEVNFPDQFLHLKKVEARGSNTTITITKAILASDIQKVRAKKMTGTLKSTKLELIDDADVSDHVATRFFIKAKWRKASDRKFYQQWVPAEFVTRDGNIFNINVGEFDLKARRFLFFKRKEYFKAGAKVKLELMIERTFGGRTIQMPVMKLVQRNLGQKDSGLVLEN
jgi:hypothetical protein